MGTRLLSTTVLASLPLAAALFLGGCLNLGCGCPPCDQSQFPPATASATLQNVQDDYARAEQQTEATADALTELSLSPTQDLPQAFATYCENWQKMQSTGDPLIRHADGLHFNGASYLVEPAPAIACPAPGQPRVTMQVNNLGDFFEPVAESSWEVKQAYRAYQADIDQFHDDRCGKPVTPALISGLRFFFLKSQIDSDRLVEALKEAQAVIYEAKSAKPQAAQK